MFRNRLIQYLRLLEASILDPFLNPQARVRPDTPFTVAFKRRGQIASALQSSRDFAPQAGRLAFHKSRHLFAHLLTGVQDVPHSNDTSWWVTRVRYTLPCCVDVGERLDVMTVHGRIGCPVRLDYVPPGRPRARCSKMNRGFAAAGGFAGAALANFQLLAAAPGLEEHRPRRGLGLHVARAMH